MAVCLSTKATRGPEESILARCPVLAPCVMLREMAEISYFAVYAGEEV